MARSLRRLMATVFALATIIAADATVNPLPASMHCSLGCKMVCLEDADGECATRCPGATQHKCNDEGCPGEGWTDNECVPVGQT